MPWVGLESTIPAFERTKTVHILERAATVIGSYSSKQQEFIIYELIYSLHFISGIIVKNLENYVDFHKR
jgi:hypothetical protein